MLPKSRYLDYFVQNRTQIGELAILVGDIILIEKLKFPETRTAGGIYIPDSSRIQSTSLMSDKPTFYRVLLPGAGYFDDETKATVPLEAQPGDIILVGSVSAKMFSSFPLLETYEPDTIGITREADIQMRFKGEQSFGRFVGGLDSFVKAQIPTGGTDE